MRALTVIPRQANSIALSELEKPVPKPGQILARTRAIGVCGTDHEIVRGEYGEAPPGAARFIIGHESLAEVVSPPSGSGFSAGDLMVGIVRRPDPVPCANCAAGAWDHIGRIAARATWQPSSVLVTGAGTVGLLGAMMGVQRGLDVTLFDRVRDGIKPALAEKLGAHYSTGEFGALKLRPDIILECTGVPTLIVTAIGMTGPGGILCLAGLSSGQRMIDINSGLLGQTIVLEND